VTKSAPPASPRSCHSCNGAACNSLEREAGNIEWPTHPGLILKESYWRWPQRALAGNTIDFFVQVLGMSFHDAMRAITET
jgi:hypothetical protein